MKEKSSMATILSIMDSIMSQDKESMNPMAL
jgi:hypothetical protein